MNPHIEQRVVPEISIDAEIHPVLQRIYAARGIREAQELDLGLGHLLSFDSLLHIDSATDRLIQALQEQQRVLIVGDYDADGATSGALAIRLLKEFGLHHVDYLLPNRFEYGYGLSPKIVEVAKQFRPDLIITVDNGIASVDGVALARKAGIDVLITDHHLPGAELPDANVIINPNQVGDSFPSKALAGVGVVFYIMMALRAALRKIDWFEAQNINEPNLADYLDIIALGTVADVVPLDRNNRILVQQGLLRMRAGRAHSGIKALMQVAKREEAYLRSSDLGFALAPRLNAAGRLDDMSLGVECLLTDDMTHAQRLAAELDAMNQERREISRSMEDEAVSMMQNLHLGDEEHAAYCLYQEDWHQGVIGILAGRIKDQTHRPVIVFANGDDGELRGSARSISGFHIRDALDAIASANPGLIQKFGGHAMAAGLSLNQSELESFTQLFQAYADMTLDEDSRQARIMTDGQLGEDDFNLQTAMELEAAGPWGQAFPEPRFEGVFRVADRRRIGSDKAHLKLRLEIGSQQLDAIAFFKTDEDWPPELEEVRLVYEMNINRFRGDENLQLIVHHVEI